MIYKIIGLIISIISMVYFLQYAHVPEYGVLALVAVVFAWGFVVSLLINTV